MFVHGIFGDDTTWGKGDVTLPKLLAKDPELSSLVDVFLFEYSTPYLGNAGKIPDLAAQLRGALEDNQVWQMHEKVIFVAHSMGGLIVRQDLITEKDRVRQVPMMYFYAVPTNGAAVAEVARRILKQPQLNGMLPIEGDSFLDALMYDWMSDKQLKGIPTFCAFEGQPTYGFWIVPQPSALALCTEVADPLTADHIQIVKPHDQFDPKFTRLATNVRNSLRLASIMPRQEGPSPAPVARENQNLRTRQAEEDAGEPAPNPPGIEPAKEPMLDTRWTNVRSSELTIGARTFSLLLTFNAGGSRQKEYGDFNYMEMGGASICSATYKIAITPTTNPKIVEFQFDHKTVAVSEEGCLAPLPADGKGTITTDDFFQVSFHGNQMLERVGTVQPAF